MYTFLTCYGYYIMKDSVWLPWFLGGNGSVEKIWENAPFGATVAGASTYAFVQLGFLTGEFINLLRSKESRNDFMEMLLHHVVTFAVVMCMILANMLPVGCVILFLHDIADV
jgi:ceramide synthetase